jgi:hypothetical protein
LLTRESDAVHVAVHATNTLDTLGVDAFGASVVSYIGEGSSGDSVVELRVFVLTILSFVVYVGWRWRWCLSFISVRARSFQCVPTPSPSCSS